MSIFDSTENLLADDWISFLRGDTVLAIKLIYIT